VKAETFRIEPYTDSEGYERVRAVNNRGTTLQVHYVGQQGKWTRFGAVGVGGITGEAANEQLRAKIARYDVDRLYTEVKD